MIILLLRHIYLNRLNRINTIVLMNKLQKDLKKESKKQNGKNYK